MPYDSPDESAYEPRQPRRVRRGCDMCGYGSFSCPMCETGMFEPEPETTEEP